MRIVHGLSDIAGLPALLAQAQREAGYQATAAVFATARGTPLGAVNLTELLRGNRLTRKLRRARVLAWMAEEFDLLHLHFHTSLLRGYRDLALFKALGKTIVYHLHGCDIRDPRRVRVEHALSACATCPLQCMTEVKLGLPGALRRYADAVIVATPDLLEFVPGAIYIPNPVDPTPWLYLPPPLPKGPDQPLVVVHAPTDRDIKGTRHIQAAIESLRGEGLSVELRLLEGMSRPTLMAACRDADIAVDQVLIGWFGLFALEMLALRKPVVAYIRPDLRHVHAGLPIVSAEPATLVETLRGLLLDPARRRALGARGPAWVEDHHSLPAINGRILDLYGSLKASK